MTDPNSPAMATAPAVAAATISPAEPSDPGPSHPGARQPALDVRQAILESVSIRIDAFLGTASMTVGALGRCEPGTVVPLDRTLADLVDLTVNGVVVARGELVAVQDRFAVRITTVAEA